MKQAAPYIINGSVVIKSWDWDWVGNDPEAFTAVLHTAEGPLG